MFFYLQLLYQKDEYKLSWQLLKNADNFNSIAFFRILDRNPLTIVEDSYLLKLPALRYL